MDARERATRWLIEHNHHGCHLDVDPSADMPLSADVDALAALLTEAEADGRRSWSPPKDVMRALEAMACIDGAHFNPTKAERVRLGTWLAAVRKS